MRFQRSIYLLVLLGILSSQVLAVDCSTSSFRPTSQAEIDRFQTDYGPCDHLTGNLTISDLKDVTNLDGLEGLQTVTGSLSLTNNPQLVDTRGLFYLREVGEVFKIDSNPLLEEFFGGNIAKVGALALSNNELMFRFTGLDTLTAAGEIYIADNPAMWSLNGFYGLRAAKRVSLARNPLINRLDDLGNLEAVGSLTIIDMEGLNTLAGLWSLHTANTIYIENNANLNSLEGLRNVVEVSSVHIASNPRLVSLSGFATNLTSPTYSPRLFIMDNAGLTGINTFDSLVSASTIQVLRNPSLRRLDDFPSLIRINESLSIEGNGALESILGLAALEHVWYSVRILNNPSLDTCHGLLKALDYIDDGDPGPGPGTSGIPDVGDVVTLENNKAGCNSVSELLADIPLDHINAGIGDAWYDPETAGQGFQINVFPVKGQIFLTWFTFDTERPPSDVQAHLGEPGHRWLTAQGPYEGTGAELDVWISEGGIFDSGVPAPYLRPDGQITLEFSTCNEGTLAYDIPSIGRENVISIERVAIDNVALCAQLNVTESLGLFSGSREQNAAEAR